MKPVIKLISTIIILFMISLACNLPTLSPATQEDIPDEQVEEPEVESEEGEDPSTDLSPEDDEKPPVIIQASAVYPPPFAEYPNIQVSIPDSFSGGYNLPIDLNQVKGTENLTLSDQQWDSLKNNGFVVLPPDIDKTIYREFYQVYESGRYQEIPSFVTVDSVLHIYHLIFDKMLRDLETESLIPTLERLTTLMLESSYQQFIELQGSDLQEIARRNLAFFGVAAKLLELPDAIPQEVNDLVQAEMALIEAHQGPNLSPIWLRDDLADDEKLIEDYSQFIPRGHYTRSDALKRYFKTMMWYGRFTFRLKDDFETRRALLLMQALRSSSEEDGTSAETLWKTIYDPTTFIVGKADDLSYTEYAVISDAVFGENPALLSYGDETLMADFKETAKLLPPPQVNSMWVWIWEDRDDATQGFRFMGQRFTLDAYVFGQVMWRKVGTSENPRDLPKALDFFSAMGSDEALNILTEMGESSYEHYDTQMEKVRNDVATLENDSWTQNLYWSWLYAFQPVIEVKDQSYPAFMQTQAWTRKDLNTALGSWTELKHDTILYAKQVMAEMGGGPGPEHPPIGYVEPNPEAYARLYALSSMTMNGLKSRGILTPNIQFNLENLMDLLSFLQSAAERELAGVALTEDEYWRLKFYGGELEAMTLAAADTQDGDSRDLSDQYAAVVADVATGIDRVLEEGVGSPVPIYVILPDEPYRIGMGSVFTYYEFIVSPSERMTDETWRDKVNTGNTPPSPTWTELFMME
ncbi:MAG: DUF3160 domain-containing protein [Anaerolineaceae bacterium]|nr:DUF3160 domain-containing protein [Anaerolineaceae bacterium]